MLNLDALSLGALYKAGRIPDLPCPERRARNKRVQPD